MRVFPRSLAESDMKILDGEVRRCRSCGYYYRGCTWCDATICGCKIAKPKSLHPGDKETGSYMCVRQVKEHR